MDSGSSSTILMVRLIENTPKEYAMVQWHIQAGRITTSIKVEIDFTSTKLSVKKIATLNCHVIDSAKGEYDMILGRDILTELGLNIKLSDHVIE